MTEFDISRSLREALVSLGVPKDSIFMEMEISTGTQRPYRADLLVVAEDKRTPVLVFEVKKGASLPMTYQNARRQMAGALGLFPCFIATVQGEEIKVTRIIGYEVKDVEWVSLSNSAELKKLIGDYFRQSEDSIKKYASETSEGVTLKMAQFRKGLIVSGTLIILVAYLVEMVTDKKMSYQLAGIIGLVFILYAASYGIIKEIKAGSKQISFHSTGDKVETDSEQKTGRVEQ